jgi:hypothetical protein
MFGAISNAWNNAPSFNDVKKGVEKGVGDAGKAVNKGVNNAAKVGGDMINDAGNGLKHAGNKIAEVAKDAHDYTNIGKAIWDNIMGYPCHLDRYKDEDKGGDNWIVRVELRIMNTFGDTVTDTFEINYEEFALDLADDFEGFASNVSWADHEKGPTGFNRVFEIRVNAPGAGWKKVRKTAEDNVTKTMKKIHSASASCLKIVVQSCQEFDNDWKDVPRSMKKIMAGILSGKVEAAEAEDFLLKELRKKIDKKIKQKIDKKIRKIVAKKIVRILLKNGIKASSKSVFKKIPGVGAVVGFGYGIAAIAEGNYESAGFEIASGVAGTIPGPGTAISLALDAAGASLEIKRECDKWWKVVEKCENL